jgi:hypothetical protein
MRFPREFSVNNVAGARVEVEERVARGIVVILIKLDSHHNGEESEPIHWIRQEVRKSNSLILKSIFLTVKVE